MSLAYRFLYRIGFTPWEQMGEAPFADEIVTLFEREESGREPPYGPALDIGCGRLIRLAPTEDPAIGC